MKIFCSINHPNIAKCHGYDYNYHIGENIENQRIFYIIMENIFPTKNIIENVSMLPNYSKQIIEALRYIHSNNIVHMDIKKENILLTIQDIVKIIDFGESHLISDFTDQVSGSISHMAPELMNGTFSKNYIHLCDIWSLGITICDIYLENKINGIYQNLLGIYKGGLNLSKYKLYKKMIFYEICLKNTTDIKIRFDTFSRIEIEDFLDATRRINMKLYIFCDFINKCLHVDYRMRWNAHQLLDHPYLLSIR
jgi:serine/threonine protein kinase